MQDREFFAKVLGLTKPWAVKDVKLDLEGTKVEVVLEASGEHDWKTAGGQRAHVHGWETRQWRHLDTMQLETVLTAKVPRLLDPQTGKTEMAVVPWAQKGSRWTMRQDERGQCLLFDILLNKLAASGRAPRRSSAT